MPHTSAWGSIRELEVPVVARLRGHGVWPVGCSDDKRSSLTQRTYLMRSFPSILLLGSSLVVTACAASGDATSDDSAESAADSADAASAEGNMMMAATEGSNLSAVELTAEIVAGNVAANLSARFQPSTCAVITQTGLTLKAVFNDCTGIRGLLHVSGELD